VTSPLRLVACFICAAAYRRDRFQLAETMMSGTRWELTPTKGTR
jgi:hypothetical protein